MQTVNLPIAFFGGLVSFFAPCVIPLLPAYVGYATGVSVNELKKAGSRPFFVKMLISSLFYIFGFSVVFVLFGTAAATVGVALRRYDYIIQRVGGLLILVFGLEFAGFLKLGFLAKQRQLALPSWLEKAGYLRSFFVGFIFATAWTPCIGAVLGAILALAAVSQTAASGAVLLFVYSLGISIPFMVVSLTLASAPKYISVVAKHSGKIAKFAGITLAILGLLLVTDTYKYLNSWIFEIAFKLGYQIK